MLWSPEKRRTMACLAARVPLPPNPSKCTSTAKTMARIFFIKTCSGEFMCEYWKTLNLAKKSTKRYYKIECFRESFLIVSARMVCRSMFAFLPKELRAPPLWQNSMRPHLLIHPYHSPHVHSLDFSGESKENKWKDKGRFLPDGPPRSRTPPLATEQESPGHAKVPHNTPPIKNITYRSIQNHYRHTLLLRAINSNYRYRVVLPAENLSWQMQMLPWVSINFKYRYKLWARKKLIL